MYGDLPANWADKLTAGAAKTAMETPCEKMERHRRLLAGAGVPYPKELPRELEAELHNEAEDAGMPCPCGWKFTRVVQE